MLLTYFSPYIPTRTRLQEWRNIGEIMILRALTTTIRAAQHEAWRTVLVWGAGAAVAGLAAGFLGTVLLIR